jgi:hypothetical protein
MPVSSLTLQMLQWLAESPRPYSEVMEAWRSACPRMTIWEDALKDGLVRYEGSRTRLVRLTVRGAEVVRMGSLPPPQTAGAAKELALTD